MDKIFEKTLHDGKKNVIVPKLEVLAIKRVDMMDNPVLEDLRMFDEPNLKKAIKHEMKRRLIVSIKYALQQMTSYQKKKVFDAAGIQLKKQTYAQFVETLYDKPYSAVHKIKTSLEL